METTGNRDQELDRIIKEVMDENIEAIGELRDHIQKYELKHWGRISQYLYYIERVAMMNREARIIGIWIVSQCCQLCYNEGYIQILKRFYQSNDYQVKLEVIKALSAISQVNSEYYTAINNNFSADTMINEISVSDIDEILFVLCKFQHELPVQERIMRILEIIIESNDNFEYVLKLLNELTSSNPKSSEYFTNTLLLKLLNSLNLDETIKNLILKIIGNYVVNVENSYTRLLPLKIFDYLLYILHVPQCTQSCLWVISNLICESHIVIEILIVNQGYIDILDLLNDNRRKIQKEVVYIMHNSSRLCTSEQSEYFFNVGAITAILKMLDMAQMEEHRIIVDTIINFTRKRNEIKLEELEEISCYFELSKMNDHYFVNAERYINSLLEE